MTTMGKFWLWVIFWFVLSVFGVMWVKSQPERSIAYQKNVAPRGDLGKLYSELGIEQGKHVRLNPCFDIEELTRKYCSPHAMQMLLVETEDQVLSDLLSYDDPCEQVALHIGRICHQENFKKIFKHFPLKK